MRNPLLGSLFLFAVSLTVRCGSGGADTDNTVVVYTSVDAVFARPVAEAFQRETGIQVQVVPDTEETKSRGLLNRLIGEKERPQADVFWSGELVRGAILKLQGVSTPYTSPASEVCLSGLPIQE